MREFHRISLMAKMCMSIGASNEMEGAESERAFILFRFVSILFLCYFELCRGQNSNKCYRMCHTILCRVKPTDFLHNENDCRKRCHTRSQGNMNGCFHTRFLTFFLSTNLKRRRQKKNNEKNWGPTNERTSERTKKKCEKNQVEFVVLR